MTISTNYGDLLKRQAWLQQAGAAHLGECDIAQIRMALLAEIGELAQELKPEWAWWRKAGDSGQVDRDKTLSESADVLHFALLLDIRLGVDRSEVEITPWPELLYPNYQKHVIDLTYRVLDGADTPWGLCMARHLCSIVAAHGFSPYDLVAAYWEKTEVNLRRWAAAQ